MTFAIRKLANFNPDHFSGAITYEDIASGSVLVYEKRGFSLPEFEQTLAEVQADSSCRLVSYAIEGNTTNVAKFSLGLREGLVD